MLGEVQLWNAGTSDTRSGVAPFGRGKPWLFTNVQVTVSPAATSMSDTELPSSQVADCWVQVGGTVSATE